MSKANKTLIFSAIILASAFLILSWPAGQNRNFGDERNAPESVITVSLFVDGLTAEAQEMEVKENKTVLEILEIMNEQDAAYDLKLKEYPGLGTLVEKIGEKRNGDNNRYWQYFINGEQPMVGADRYILKNNDKIEWLFKESQF